jgi:hypothetical protein
MEQLNDEKDKLINYQQKQQQQQRILHIRQLQRRELKRQQQRRQNRINELTATIHRIIDKLQNIYDEKEEANQEVIRILHSTHYLRNIHKVLNDCVEIENDREHLEQNSQDYESTPNKSKGSLQKYITPLPGVPAPSGIDTKFPPPPDDDNKPPPFSLGTSSKSTTSGRHFKRTEKIRPVQSSKGGQKTTRKKNIKKYICRERPLNPN